MDTFDLKWPQSDATFYTDGWRCRIVWRERRGGLGGAIDNNDQCKRRVADSLMGAPYLLNALRARGHGLLAEEIAGLSEVTVSQEVRVSQPAEGKPAVTRAAKAPKTVKGPKKPKAAPARKPDAATQISSWLKLLEGESGWEDSGLRRAKVWRDCAELEGQTLALKTPAAKGKQEWVLKTTFADSKRKAEYVTAPSVRGICECLNKRGVFSDASAVEAWLTGLEDADHAALAQAATVWREIRSATTH